MTPPAVSVVIRARNEAANLDRTLTALRAQRLGPHGVETIVVDNGSADGTGMIAGRHGATVIDLPAERFTFGGALNLGVANARADVVIALSADAAPPDRGWLERMIDALDPPHVACASGDRFGADGEPLARRTEQDEALARRRPEWGYSNAAGVFRRELWRRRPFRSDLPGCEDKEWALHWLRQGYVCAIDPGLTVEHDHSHDPAASIYRRARREWHGYAMFLELDHYGARDLARDWWSDVRWYDSPLRARLSHRRAARLLGGYAGRRWVRARGGSRRGRASAAES
jgi:glycosyltransferase involved in cell wall biosynthesis